MAQKLLVIGARSIPDAEGGIEKYVTEMLPRLAELGFETHAVCMNTHGAEDHFRGVSISRVPTLSLFLTDKHIYLLFALYTALRVRPDVILLLGTAATLLTLPSLLLAKRVVVRCGLFDTQSNKWGLLGRLFISLAEAQYRFASGIIGVSTDIAKSLRLHAGRAPVVFIPNGLDAARQNLSNDLDARITGRYILAVGRMTRQKDYLTLARAFKRCSAPDVQLVICGASDGSLSSAELAEFEHDRIVWLGFIKKPALYSYLQGASVYVNSSIVEGMSNSLLEAMSYDRPIVASDISANREVSQIPGCAYFPVGDVQALALKLDNALLHPDRYVADKTTALTWDDVAKMTGAFLHPDQTAVEGNRDETVPSFRPAQETVSKEAR